MSEPIQSIAQNNYILQAPPPTATMFTTELEYDGDKISGYAGSAFKAGTDLEFGYDSADNISAINNSAISQTPSQKLYLQSPLTTGVSGTSAYIGILSADLARMLGVDETVLFENINGQKNFTTLEPLTNFNEINFYLNSNSNSPVIKTTVPMYGRNISELHLFFSDIYAGDWKRIDWHWYYSNTGMSSFNYTSGYYKGVQGQGTWDKGEWPANAECYIYKVIGIGRKQ